MSVILGRVGVFTAASGAWCLRLLTASS